MAQSINDQLQELAQFKTLISIILRETGNTAPDTGFRQWYQAIKTALLKTNGLTIIDKFEVIPKLDKLILSEDVAIKNYLQIKITDSFSFEKVES